MKNICSFVILAVILGAFALYAQGKNSVLGYSGLVITPTAEILPDGELTFNMGRIPTLYAKNYYGGSFDRTAFVAVMGFMPFMEASFGFVRPDNMQGGVGDRTVTIRFRVLREQTFLPAIAVGFHDFFAIESIDLEPEAAQHFTTSYIVGTKSFQFPLRDSSIRLNLGYGFDWLPSNDSQFHGLFWGAEFSPMKNVHLLLEHDTITYNAGVRFLFSHLQYTLSFWQLKYTMHQLSFSINLK